MNIIRYGPNLWKLNAFLFQFYAMFYSVWQESAEQATVKRADSVNSMVENDEIARRLKLFVEKLEYDKTELYHQLQEEKKYVFSHCALHF